MDAEGVDTGAVTTNVSIIQGGTDVGIQGGGPWLAHVAVISSGVASLSCVEFLLLSTNVGRC